MSGTPAFQRESDGLLDNVNFGHLERSNLIETNEEGGTSERSTISRESSLSLLSLDSIQDRSDLAPH